MLDVRCEMWDVRCELWNAAQEYFSRRCHRSTQKPCGVLVNNTDCAAGAEDRHRYFAGGEGC